MIRLIKLELKQFKVQSYFKAAFILGIFLLLFIYFVAIVAQVTEENDFMIYKNIFRFFCAISILIFSIFAAILYNERTIKAYDGKRFALLYTYPVSRKKIFLIKVLLVTIISSVCMFLCTMIPIMIFIVMESWLAIVPDHITSGLLLSTFKMMIVAILSVNTIAIFAMTIGFINQSKTLTLISSLIFACFYGNMVINTSLSILGMQIITGFSICMIIIVLIILTNRVKRMEAI